MGLILLYSFSRSNNFGLIRFYIECLYLRLDHFLTQVSFLFWNQRLRYLNVLFTCLYMGIELISKFKFFLLLSVYLCRCLSIHRNFTWWNLPLIFILILKRIHVLSTILNILNFILFLWRLVDLIQNRALLNLLGISLHFIKHLLILLAIISMLPIVWLMVNNGSLSFSVICCPLRHL